MVSSLGSPELAKAVSPKNNSVKEAPLAQGFALAL